MCVLNFDSTNKVTHNIKDLVIGIDEHNSRQLCRLPLSCFEQKNDDFLNMKKWKRIIYILNETETYQQMILFI